MTTPTKKSCQIPVWGGLSPFSAILPIRKSLDNPAAQSPECSLKHRFLGFGI
jgi:hypothetical protein